MSHEHTLDASQIHHDWDSGREPALAIQSGDVVHFGLPITGDGQVSETSTVDKVVWDFDTIYNLAGPIHVGGAAPGDTLEVEIVQLTPGPWGWTTVIPGLGLLAEEYPDPFLKIYDLRGGTTATVAPGVEVPIRPFLGTMGVVTGEPGRLAPFPPHRAVAMSTAGTSSPGRRCGCPSGATGLSSPAATLTRLRETGRCASVRSSAR